MSDDKVRETIRRLLTIASDEAPSPAERELAMELATVLMARHSITTHNTIKGKRHQERLAAEVDDMGTPSLLDLLTHLA